MERSTWIRAIPEIGDRFVREADALAKVKAELRARLEDAMRAEAALWVEIVKTDQWSRKETFGALTKMDAELIRYLPSDI